MKVLKEKLGQDMCNNTGYTVSIHAILGCDTTVLLAFIALERGPL